MKHLAIALLLPLLAFNIACGSSLPDTPLCEDGELHPQVFEVLAHLQAALLDLEGFTMTLEDLWQVFNAEGNLDHVVKGFQEAQKWLRQVEGIFRTLSPLCSGVGSGAQGTPTWNWPPPPEG